MVTFNSLLHLADSFASNPDALGLPSVSLDSGLRSVIQIVFVIIGLLSTIFIIVGGVRYTLSGGDASGIKSAKETIIYAIVGLVISLLAFGIVNYVTHLR